MYQRASTCDAFNTISLPARIVKGQLIPPQVLITILHRIETSESNMSIVVTASYMILDFHVSLCLQGINMI